jgi:3-hydroxyacyl-[acyl-carrier-protein] dehydratase
VRFQLVDRIVHVEPWRTVTARKVTSRAETHWQMTPDGPRMAPTLVLEALCQAGTWLILVSTERRRRAALLSVGSCSFTGPVRPGDIIELEGVVDSVDDDRAVLSGVARVDGRPVLVARHIMCALLDAETLAADDDTRCLEQVLLRSVA